MDVGIIGGGIVGGSIAHHLLQQDADVTLFEKDDPCSATTARASGGFRQQFSTPENVRFSIYARDFYESFEEQFGVDPEFTQHGYLFLLNDPVQKNLFEHRAAMQQRLGVDVEQISPEEIADRYPQLDTRDVLAGFFCGQDAYFKPQKICNGIIQSIQERGATIHEHTRVTDIQVENSAVTGIRTDGKEHSFDTVINASGPWAPDIGAMAGVELPVFPKKRQVALVGPSEPLADDLPLVSDFSNSTYFRRWDDGTALIGGNWHSPDPTVDPANFDWEMDDSWYDESLSRAQEISPLFEDVDFQRGWSGMYAVTPDRKAIIDQTGPEGFYTAAGFSGHGAMHAPATGRAVADLVTTGRSQTLDIEPFSLDRFELYEI